MVKSSHLQQRNSIENIKTTLFGTRQAVNKQVSKQRFHITKHVSPPRQRLLFFCCFWDHLKVPLLWNCWCLYCQDMLSSSSAESSDTCLFSIPICLTRKYLSRPSCKKKIHYWIIGGLWLEWVWKICRKTCHFKLTFQQSNTVPIDGSQGDEVTQHNTARQKTKKTKKHVVMPEHRKWLTM